MGPSDSGASAVAPPPVAAHVLEEHKLREFCHALMFRTGFNATEAYLAVEPHVQRNTAGEQGYRLLKRDETRRILADMAKAAWERHELDQDFIIGSWIAIARADVMDFFEADDTGILKLRNLEKVDAVKRRNIAAIKVTTQKVNEMVVEQRVELKLCDKVAVLRDMGNASGLLRDLGEKGGSSDVASAIEQGFERVRRKLGGRTFDGAGLEIPTEETNG